MCTIENMSVTAGLANVSVEAQALCINGVVQSALQMLGPVAKSRVINCPFINVRKRSQTLDCTLKNAQLIVQLHGSNVQLHGQTSYTFYKRIHKRVLVHLHAETYNCRYERFRNGFQIRRSIVLYNRNCAFTNVHERSQTLN
jgi:hypothetical protein